MNGFMWIILLLTFMSLTLARSEREQGLLTHANQIKFIFELNSEVVSNVHDLFFQVAVIANKDLQEFLG